MSSSKRGAVQDGKILASLETGSSPAKARADRAPVHELWRKGRNSLLLVLCVCLLWFTYDNATSFTFSPEPVVAVAEPKTPAQVAPAVQPAPMPPPAAAVIREEPIAAPPVAAAAPPEPITAIDKTKPAARPSLARKPARPAPVVGPEAPPDSDVVILSAIVAQTHAAKAAAGR